MTHWDPHLGSVVHRTCEGLIKAKTSLGPQGFLVGTFEGFEAQPFVTEVPNLALHKSKPTRNRLSFPWARIMARISQSRRARASITMGSRRGSWRRARSSRRRGSITAKW